jgi:hypothetical protein
MGIGVEVGVNAGLAVAGGIIAVGAETVGSVEAEAQAAVNTRKKRQMKMKEIWRCLSVDMLVPLLSTKMS